MNNQTFYKIATILTFYSYLSFQAACAQTPTLQNSIEQIDPGRAAEELTPNQQRLPLSPSPDIRTPKAKQPKTKKNAKAIQFTLLNITLKGNTVFSEIILQEIYKNKIGQKISAAELQQIATDITNFYRDNGYILTQVIIPPQEIDKKGIATLQIIEGYISKVIIQGSKTKSINRLLEKYGQQIIRSKPLHSVILERFALLANDIPGTTVKTIITTSETIPGAADLTFIVNNQDTNWNIGTNNYNAPVLGQQQINASFYLNNFVPGSQTGISSVISSTDSRLIYLALQHKQTINNNGLNLDFSFSNTKTKPDLTKLGLNNLYVPGEAFLFTTNLHYPIVRSRKQNLILSGGFKLLNSHTDYYSGYLSKDNVRSINANLIYDFFSISGSVNTAIFGISQGLDIISAQADPPTRVGGKNNFTKLNLFLSTKQQLLRRPIYLLIELNGQYAFNQLLSSETFGYGGVPFGYAYDQSAITGDSGMAARIELQYQLYINSADYYTLQFFGFGDGGIVWNINKITQTPRQQAASTGAGIRIGTLRHVRVELAIAQPLNKNIDSGDNKNLRFLFNAQLVF